MAKAPKLLQQNTLSKRQVTSQSNQDDGLSKISHKLTPWGETLALSDTRVVIVRRWFGITASPVL
eukprot:1804530-Amphidinium_carterae.1